MENLDFYKITLPLANNLFKELSESVEFEKITNGRIANNLVFLDNNIVPIVRTTSKYNLPAQNFSSIHNDLIKTFNQTVINNNLKNIPYQHFNNALIEIYDLNYLKMNFHSDQSLDLDNHSFIALFSCYEYPDKLDEYNIRKLKIKNKLTNDEFELSLSQNSIILFSTETNMKFQHKIVLDIDNKRKIPMTQNRWLGMTFRTSKTKIEFINKLPFLPNGEQLKLADEEQERAFFKLRGEENRSLDFIYPQLNYTISLADTLFPKNFR